MRRTGCCFHQGRRARERARSIAVSVLAGIAGCVPGALPEDGVAPAYANTTDPTNGGARYVGSAACRSCHPDIAGRLHGHSQVLKPVEGRAPVWAAGPGVPDPPHGFGWEDVSYVVGGYMRKAVFVDARGYILTNGLAGVDTQWNLAFPANGSAAAFAPYEPGAAAPTPYGSACFACHTTGPQPFDPADPRYQESRPGLKGIWQEAGVQCEACHGPGANHVPNPQRRDLYVNASAAACSQCHSRSGVSGPAAITAGGGFIEHYQQYSELRASGGHAGLACTVCHDPHTGPTYDRARSIRTTCEACHPDRNMAFHEGAVVVRGGRVEEITCVSCHMPLAGRSATSAVRGASAGRIGDVRTHLFRVNTARVDYRAMFTEDLSQVLVDAQGRAAVTLDFVCLRCHNGENGYPFALTLKSASEAAPGLHLPHQGDAGRG